MASMSEFPAAKREPSALDVAAFLRRNPNFLNEFPELALSLTLPRQQGSTTSLASYQLEVLRDKNRGLMRRMHELVAIASENEQLMIRVHALTLSLMRAASVPEVLRRVVATLNEDLSSDMVRIVLFQPVPGEAGAEWLVVASGDDRGLRTFQEFLAKGEPLCGRLNEDKLGFLFGARAADVRSALLIPIPTRGFVAVGSSDPNRFHPGMGTMFLKLIAEAVGAAIARFETA
jgi:uncharacterized protein YigA (DUF484 family)